MFIKTKSNKARNPYTRAKWLALASMAALATLLNVVLRDWIAALHLAVVVVFTTITVGLVVRTLVVAIADRLRRNGEDSGESGGGHGGPDDPPQGPIDLELIDPLRHQDDFGLAA